MILKGPIMTLLLPAKTQSHDLLDLCLRSCGVYESVGNGSFEMLPWILIFQALPMDVQSD